MKLEVRHVLQRVAESVDFAHVDLSDVNATSLEGDNALHCVVRWDDLEAAKSLIDAGIDVNQSGDLGFTPLHVACMQGNMLMVEFLVANGADLFSMSEGDTPFAKARLHGHDQICDYLSPLIKDRLTANPQAYLRSRIAQLKRELAKLEARLTV
jgi:ankyrin repeat protein